MASSEFAFLRATFYRWARLFTKHCGEVCDGPKVLGVGDLHIENFGTWRDAEGRLSWGVNDFDEACLLPYTNDLVGVWITACELNYMFYLTSTAALCIRTDTTWSIGERRLVSLFKISAACPLPFVAITISKRWPRANTPAL